MMERYVEGYTSKADYCPYCGKKVYRITGSGVNICDDCGMNFYIIETD